MKKIMLVLLVLIPVLGSSKGVSEVGDRSFLPVLEKLDDEITVDEVLAKFLEFSGGEEVIKGLKDVSYTMVMSIQGMTMETFAKTVLGDDLAFSIVTKMNGCTMMDIRYKDGIAEMNSPEGSRKLSVEESIETKSKGYPIIEAYVEELGIVTTLEGIEDVNGKTQAMIVGEYKTYDNGIVFPMSLEMNTEGKNLKIEFKDVKFDTGLTI